MNQGNKIWLLLQQGKTQKQIREEIGCSKSLVSYFHVKGRGAIQKKLQYNWKEIRQYYEQGNTVNDCMGKFGFSGVAWWKAVRRGDIISRVLMTKDLKNNESVKARLIHSRGHRCEKCNRKKWLGRKITIELHHKDGDRKNNEESNVELLCPNCHSFTDNWKNSKKKVFKAIRSSVRTLL